MILIAGAKRGAFAPALNVSEEEVNSGLDGVERACARFVAGLISDGYSTGGAGDLPGC